MRAEQNFKWEKLSLGTCYYPEHWDKKLWRDDLRRMKENGIFTIRIAEFAWNKIEPCEGDFTYEFFDEFLDVAEEEQTEQQARNGLSHVKVGRPLACALGVLERNTGDHFVRSRRMSELDLFRSRHD